MRDSGVTLKETSRRSCLMRLFDTERVTTMNGPYNYGAESVKYGVSFGTALAIAISYTNNHSILWAIIHGIFSWLYVIYFALFH
jgi:hypothetical protein